MVGINAIPDNPNQPAVNSPAVAPSAPSGPPAGWKGYNGMSYGDTNWYNNYSQAITNGQNNSYQLGKYQQLAKQYGLKDYSQGITQDALKQRSIKALEGDQDSITYLKNMGYKPMSGDALWGGMTSDQINSSPQLRQAYVAANPTSDFTRNYDQGFINKYNDMIQNNKPMSQDELNWYNSHVAKWNEQNYTDPSVQQQQQFQNELTSQKAQEDQQLKAYQDMMNSQKAQQDSQLKAYQDAYNQQASMFNTDKQNALNAQDVALNNGLQAADANNFQTMQKTQQDMINRGIADSGLAQDAYARATMAANQQYQKAYADAATNKADLASKYDTTLAGLQNDMNNGVSKLYDQYNNSQNGLLRDMSGLYDQYNNSADNLIKNMTDSKIQQQQNMAAQAAEQAKQQQAQDQFLTQQSGYIFMNGKPLTDPNTGKPYTTLDWAKMSETQRHDLATEANTAQQNQNTYNIASMNNDTSRAKIAADTAIANAKLQYDYKNLDFNKAKWAQDVQDTISKLNIAQQNANTSSDKNTLSALQTEVTNARDAVTAAQKAKDTKGAASAEKRLEAALGNVDKFISGKQ